jgi:hypothetical protein
MPTDPSPAEPRPESLYAALRRWASHANARTLAGMLVLGVAGTSLILLLTRGHNLLFAGYVVALGATGGWGLLEQRPGPHLDWLDTVQAWLVGLGMVSAVAALIATLFWAMGRAPTF